jgi:cell pole-organizing protein PopZ
MSKLDPTGENLESILASIRRSLAEQATDVLAEDGAPLSVSPDALGAVVPGEDAPPRFIGRGGLEARQPEMLPPPHAPLPAGFSAQADRAFAGLDDPPPPASISAALARRDEASRSAAPAAIPASAPAEAGTSDPLWFLARGKDSIPAAPQAAAAPQPMPVEPAALQPAPPAAAPGRPAANEPALKEIVRGPLPPFFGSSPETAKVEVSPAPPMPASLPLAGGAVMPPPAAPPASVARPAEPESPRKAAPEIPPGTPAASPVTPVGSGPLAGPASAPVRESLSNGKASSASTVQPRPNGAAPPAATPTLTAPSAASTPQLQGLEAMVADLLRPMLRQWLDENMPRLVSAALKAEAEAPSRHDPNKP